MIVGCYDMQLYCMNDHLPFHFAQDGPIVPLGFHPYGWNESFFEQTFAECKRKAKEAGWKFTKGDVICKYCQRKSL